MLVEWTMLYPFAIPTLVTLNFCSPTLQKFSIADNSLHVGLTIQIAKVLQL